MANTPPSSVCFFRRDMLEHDGDDGSELTGTCSHEDAPYHYLQVSMKNEADPSQKELMDLKVQVAGQQEKLDSLARKLNQSEAENEMLRAERDVLFDELVKASNKKPPEMPGCMAQNWFSNRKHIAGGGSIQLLTDANGRLMRDNARLQTIVDITRKSFQLYVRDRQSDARAEGQRQQLNELKLSTSEHTAKTSIETSFTDYWEPAMLCESDRVSKSSFETFSGEDSNRQAVIDSSRRSAPAIVMHNSIPISGQYSVPVTSPEEPTSKMLSKNTFTETTSGFKPTKLPVGLLDRNDIETLKPRRAAAVGKLCQSLNEGTTAPRTTSEDLLVEFGEGRRTRRTARRWNSLKW